MRLDLRYEYIDLDQPLAGRERVSAGALPRHHDICSIWEWPIP
jgi:hypothetical protein